MIGGNGFKDTNTWFESYAHRPPQGEEGRPVYNVWIPVPRGMDSVWKSISSALEDHGIARDEPMERYLMWLQLFFFHTELSGTPGGNKSTQVAEECDVE
jgi:hypothetical protein